MLQGAVEPAWSFVKTNDPAQPRCRLEEESGEANKTNKEEQQRAPIASVLEKRETEDKSARMMIMMMIPNKRASAFTPMIENRGSNDMKQKVTIPHQA